MKLLKISAKSNPNSVAGAMAAELKEHGKTELQAIGAAAISQATKAIIIARGFVAPYGVELISIPCFTELKVDGEERTAVKFIVEPR
jgi:stage V sporulation protein S